MINDIKTRPLFFSELIRLSSEIYRKYIKYITAVCLFVYLPLCTIVALIPKHFLPLSYDFNTPAYTEKMMYYLLLVLVIDAFFAPLAVAAITHIARQHIESAAVNFQGIMDCSLLRWGKLLFTALLYMASWLAGAVLVIPAIYFSIAFMFYDSTVALTGKWGLAALSESRGYVKGKWFRTFGFVLVVSLLNLCVSSSLDYLFVQTFSSNSIVYMIIASVFVNTVCIYFKVMVALKYLNYRYMSVNMGKVEP